MLEITSQKPMAGTHESLLFLLFFFFFFSLFLGLQHGWIFLSSRSLSPTAALSLSLSLSLSHTAASPHSHGVCVCVEGREKLGDVVVRDRKRESECCFIEMGLSHNLFSFCFSFY
jgi:hypothetical protein